MARSIPTIYNQLLAAKNAQSNLGVLTSQSKVSIWNLWLWIQATAENLFEQLQDLFLTNLESIISNAPVFSEAWYQYMLLQFQYSASLPQVVSVNATYGITYAVVNTSLQIIQSAAVVTLTNREVNIYVATGNPLGPLDGQSVPGNNPGPQYQALQSYLTAIGIPGTQYNIISVSPDLVCLQCEVFYNASYSGVIAANLKAAYVAFLASITPNTHGIFEVSALEDALKAVAGVNDVVIQNLSVRQWNVAFGGGTYLVETINTYPSLINRTWSFYAGYAIDETTAGEDFLSLLTLTAD